MEFAEWHILDTLFVVMGLELLPLERLVRFLGEQPPQEQFLWLLKARIKNAYVKCHVKTCMICNM